MTEAGPDLTAICRYRPTSNPRIFLILAAVTLFGSAGTLAIASFWLYLAILVAIIVASLGILDPDLTASACVQAANPRHSNCGCRLVLLMHWIVAGLDRGRLHWSDGVAPWLQAFGLVAVAGGFALFLWAMAVNRVLFLGRPHPGRPRPACYHQWTLSLRPAPGLPRRHPYHRSQRRRARIVARRGMLIIPACRSCFTARSPKTVCCTPSFRAIATTPARVRWRVLPGIW